jgi:endonuclease/exonuclease/phosphatase (EEP) superfamily protein YafD
VTDVIERPVRARPRYVLAALWTAALVVGVLPDLFGGLDSYPPFTQVVAFRPWLAAATAVLALLLGVVTAFRRRMWPLLVGTLVVALTAGFAVLPRTIAAPVPVEGRPLTVMAANVLHGDADPRALADAIRETRPDVVSLPEAADRFGPRIEPLVTPLGYRVLDTDGAVGVLVAERLGDVTAHVGSEFGLEAYVEVSGGALGDVTVVAFHAASPVRGRMAAWRADLAMLARWCAGPGRVVIAGDLNATLDHSALRAGSAGCTDAGADRGAGLVPTWGPTARTTVFGPQIDHVLATPGIDPAAFSVRDLPGSDHRIIVATLLVR